MRNILPVLFLIVCCRLVAQGDSAGVALNLPSNFFYKKLTNGLEVLVVEDRNVPLVNVNLAVKNGCFNEGPDINGVANLYNHMFFKANRDYPTQESFSLRETELGIIHNNMLSNEVVSHHITLSKKKISEGLDFLYSSVTNPSLLQDEMRKEFVNIAYEFQREETNPLNFLQEDLYKKLWGNLFSRKNTLGEYDVILNANSGKIQTMRRKYYYPNNSLLIVSGDVKHDDVFLKVSSVFEQWPKSEFDVFTKYPIPEFDTLTIAKASISVNEYAKTVFFKLGYQGPDTRYSMKETYCADIFQHIINQKNSNFQKSLVATNLAKNAQLNYQLCKYVGPITIFVEPNISEIGPCINTLISQITRFANNDYFSDEQFERAKDMIEVEYLYDRENMVRNSERIAYYWSSQGIDYYVDYIKNVRAITRQDMNDFLRKFLVNKAYIMNAVASQKLKDSLNLDKYFKETAPVEEITTFFKSGSTVTDQRDFISKLEDIEYTMRINPNAVLTVHGYADYTGPAEINKQISKKRAEFVKDFIVKRQNISPERIITVGHGALPPVKTEEEKQAQRMVKFTINFRNNDNLNEN